MMEKIGKKPGILMVIFLISLIGGLLLGFIFHKLRINSLVKKQKIQKIEEERRFNILFEKFSKRKGELEGAKPPPV